MAVKKKPDSNSIPPPEARSSYMLKASPQDRNYVYWPEVCEYLLGGNLHTVTRYLQGDFELPNFGHDLRIKGFSYKPEECAIYPDDVKKFVQRVRTFRAIVGGYAVVRSIGSWQAQQAQPKDLDTAHTFMQRDGYIVLHNSGLKEGRLLELEGFDEIIIPNQAVAMGDENLL